MTGYADIATHFRTEVEEGRLKPGDSLPSYGEITSSFSVNRTTVIRAIDMLKREGLVATRPSKPPVVTRRPRIAPLTGAPRILRGPNASGQYLAPTETTDNHTAELSPAPSGVADELGVADGEEVVVRRRVFREDGQAVVFAVSYIHCRALSAVPSLTQQGKQDRFWHEVYTEKTGKVIHRSPEMRGARHATPEELAALGLSAPVYDTAVPVLVTRVVWHDDDGPIEVWEDVHAPGKWQIEAGVTQ